MLGYTQKWSSTLFDKVIQLISIGLMGGLHPSALPLARTTR